MGRNAEPVVFVNTIPNPVPNGDEIVLLNGEFYGYRRLKPGWLSEGLHRITGLYLSQNGCVTHPPMNALRDALFPPPEPEPEPWMREAARSFFALDMDHNSPDALARHFAKARRERGNP